MIKNMGVIMMIKAKKARTELKTSNQSEQLDLRKHL